MSLQAALLLLVGVLLANHAAITAAASHRDVDTKSSTYQASDTLRNHIAARSEDPAAHTIAVLTSKRLIVERFQHVCAEKQQESGNRARHIANGISTACWSLQGSCHRVFRASIPGKHPWLHKFAPPPPPSGGIPPGSGRQPVWQLMQWTVATSSVTDQDQSL
jgi:hypothetical protein